MNLQTKLISTLALAAGMALPQPPQGGPGGPGGPGGDPLSNPMMKYVLDLSDAQLKQIQDIRQAAMTANQAIHDQLKTIHDQELAAVKAGKSDAELATLVNSGTPLVNQLRTTQLSAAAKAWKVLTPAQQAKLEQMRQEMQNRQPPQGGGPGPRFHGRFGPGQN